jgi:hypothetical protein
MRTIMAGLAAFLSLAACAAVRPQPGSVAQTPAEMLRDAVNYCSTVEKAAQARQASQQVSPDEGAAASPDTPAPLIAVGTTYQQCMERLGYRGNARPMR